MDYFNTLRLEIHSDKIEFGETKYGFIFLGHKIFKTHFTFTNRSIRRSRKRVDKANILLKFNKIDFKNYQSRVNGTLGFMDMGKNHQIKQELLSKSFLQL
jgi:hypothetical protein